MIDQGSANILVKDPDSKYFRFLWAMQSLPQLLKSAVRADAARDNT